MDTNHNLGKKRDIRKFMLDYAVYILMIIVMIVYSSLTPLFLSSGNIKSLLTNSSTLLIAAVGISFVLLVAEIDLSIGSIAGIVGTTWAVLQVTFGMNIILATVISIVIGALVGCVNGFLIVRLKINSFLVTLGMQMFLRGIIYIISSGNQVMLPSDTKKMFLPSNFGGISPLIIIALVVTIAMMFVLKFTPFGRKIQATGCNPAAAKKVGINVSFVKFSAFVVCATLAGIAGIAQVINVGMASPSMIGVDLEFLAITASVLGGVSLMGGVGTIIPGTLVGAIFLMTIENGLGLLGANPYAYPVVRGIVIYLAMFSDSLKRSFISKNK